MQSRHSLLLSLVCATVITCAAPVLAQATQQNDASPPASKRGTRQTPPSGNSAEMDAQRAVAGPYRLTYTLIEMDASKKVGTQHYSLLLDANGSPARAHFETHVSVRQGKLNSNYYVPVHIATSLNSDLRKFQNGIELRSGVDQTSIVDNQKKDRQSMSEPLPPPVTRESELYSSVLMPENQPVTLWKLDIPGSTHVLEVQAELTRVR